MLKRKLTAYLLLLTMIFSVFATNVAFAAEDVTEATTTDSEYEEYVDDTPAVEENTTSYLEAYDLITTLGIIDGLSMNGTITRGELTGYILQMLDLDISLDNLESPQIFSDVPSTHPYAAQIYACYDLGIVDGVGGGAFEPDAIATYNQAVKMVVSALGYGVATRDNDTLELNMITASGLKLTRNISESNTAEVTGGLFAQLVFNALEIKNIKLTSGGLIKEYSDKGGETVLKYHDLIKIKDVVTENPVTAIYGSHTAKNGQVKIGETSCYIGETVADIYLGYYVLAYASFVEDVDTYPTLVYCEPVSGYNDTIEITEKEWSGATLNSDYSITVTYTDGRTTKKGTLKSEADVIYNGVFSGGFDICEYVPQNADISLVDYDADGEYDIALIKEYQTLYVESISTTTYTVGGQLDGVSGNIALNPDSQDYSFKILEDGYVIGFDSIEPKDVLSVVQSLDGTYKEVHISKEVVDGVIEEISEYGTDVDVAVGYDTYDVVNYLVKDTNPFSAGDDMKFYLDFRGKIAYYVANTKSGVNYAYVISMAQNKGISNNAKLRILDSDGSIGVYECKDEILFDYNNRIDGTTLNSDSMAYKSGYTYKSAVLNQVIQYKTNSSGQIIEIVTGINDRQDPEQGLSRPQILYSDEGWGEKLTSLDAANPYLYPIRYSRDAPAFFFGNRDVPAISNDGKEDVMLVNPSATIFYVPKDTTQTEEFRFQVMRPDALTNGGDGYDMEIFNLDKNGKVHLALIRYGGAAKVSEWAECHIIDEVDKVLLEDGSESYKIKCMSSTQYVEYLVDANIAEVSNILPETLERGDIVMFGFNSEGQVNIIENFISAENLNVKMCDGAYYQDNGSLTYGKVARVDGQAIQIATESATIEHFRWYGTRGLSCAIYDKSAGTEGVFYSGTIADLEVGDWVLLRAGQAWVTQWYIIKGVD